MQKLLTESGIKWEPSVPYTPSQNGKAERVNRTLMERVRAMLLDSNLPKGMWAELINTAAYLKNRSPASSQDKTPFELWNEQRPNLSNLRIIGSIAYAHTPNQGRKKLDKQSQKYFLVGYEGSSIYHLWNPATKKVTCHSDVIFDESKIMDMAIEERPLYDNSEYSQSIESQAANAEHSRVFQHEPMRGHTTSG